MLTGSSTASSSILPPSSLPLAPSSRALIHVQVVSISIPEDEDEEPQYCNLGKINQR
jgi:hypothetical protein